MVAVLAFAGIATALMQSLIIPLVPALPSLLDTTAAGASWAVTATLLAASIATPVAGRLGDMFGKRRLLLISLGFLVLGSVVTALSDSLTPMVVGRALQGLSSGVIPLGISIMRDELPADRVGSGTATMSSSLGVGGALGLPLAALIADHTSWHMLFWGSALLGTLALVLVVRLVPESPQRTGGTVDFVGAVGLSLGLVSLLLAISKGADWGAGATVGLLVASAVTFLVWGMWELRNRQPLVDLRTSARTPVLMTNLASIALGFSMFSVRLVHPQVLQAPVESGYGLGKSMLVVGLVTAPQGLVMMAVSPLSARLTKAKGPKVTLMAGALAVTVGYVLGVPLLSEIWQLILVSCINGIGIGLAYGAMPALIMKSVPVSETGAANSLNTLMRSLGNSLSSAAVGLVLAHMTIVVGAASLPSLDAFRLVMVIGGVASLLSFALAAAIPQRATAPAATAPADAPGQ
ncbi:MULTISPECIES: MFS transporter [unclassified Streptomyces]|uniref:MFS transporter n=1 Tax=unclassified Streptomyces TaxID=2593676 RepID=UPI000377B231|nr:MFS transporter [Streptomyces sp. KhCrAH-43]MYS36759.1 MFS transporter [Streptomyces sp. SID4920]MYX69230.1 MFS transporter [Streptomyces sp. SID8373]